MATVYCFLRDECGMVLDIQKLIDEHEVETAEFKEAFSNKDVLETACAFANQRGGVILIGVCDDKTIKGVVIGKGTLEKWANDIKLGLSPAINPSITCQQIESKTVGIIRVDRYRSAAVSYGGRFYKRVGKTNHKMTYEDIISHSASYEVGWDNEPVSNCGVKSLDNKQIQVFFDDVRSRNRRQIERGSTENILKKLDLLRDDGVATRASILLLSSNPQKYFPNAYVKVGRFKTDTHILDDREIRGSVFEQIEQTLGWLKERLETELVISGSAKREVRWQFPLEALREAVANAICHRDYNQDSAVHIRLYDDRLEIWNPGKLPTNLTVEDLLKEHQSYPRNRRVHDALYNCGVVEKWGSGTQRIVASMRSMNLPAPIFDNHSPDGFRVTLRNRAFSKISLENLALSDRQIELILKHSGSITNEGYQNLFGVAKRTATRELTQLADLGILIRSGTKGRSVSYIIRSD